MKPYEVLEKFKSHKHVAKLIKGAEAQEYSAHLIPEFGYNNLPRLYANGVMVVGDAAGLVNSAHFEGTNFAIESGKLAGETAKRLGKQMPVILGVTLLSSFGQKH